MKFEQVRWEWCLHNRSLIQCHCWYEMALAVLSITRHWSTSGASLLSSLVNAFFVHSITVQIILVSWQSLKHAVTTGVTYRIRLEKKKVLGTIGKCGENNQSVKELLCPKGSITIVSHQWSEIYAGPNPSSCEYTPFVAQVTRELLNGSKDSTKIHTTSHYPCVWQRIFKVSLVGNSTTSVPFFL